MKKFISLFVVFCISMSLTASDVFVSETTVTNIEPIVYTVDNVFAYFQNIADIIKYGINLQKYIVRPYTVLKTNTYTEIESSKYEEAIEVLKENFITFGKYGFEDTATITPEKILGLASDENLKSICVLSILKTGDNAFLPCVTYITKEDNEHYKIKFSDFPADLNSGSYKSVDEYIKEDYSKISLFVSAESKTFTNVKLTVNNREQIKNRSIDMYIENGNIFISMQEMTEISGYNVDSSQNQKYIRKEKYIALYKSAEMLGFNAQYDYLNNTLNLKFGNKINSDELDEFINQYGGDVSVCYENLVTGEKYTYNAEQIYDAASVMKAPYSLFVYDMALQKKIDLNEKLTYREGYFIPGTGIIKDNPYNTQYTVECLLDYAIRHSDNIALKMLVNRFGVDSFKDYAKNWGVSAENIYLVQLASITANEGSIYARKIYEFIEKNNTSYESKKFKEDLMNTRNKMIMSSYSYPTARKYGWTTTAFHDMAIIYAPVPYTLTILSKRINGTWEDFEMFRKISLEVEAMHLK